jgi:hypothetical protein
MESELSPEQTFLLTQCDGLSLLQCRKMLTPFLASRSLSMRTMNELQRLARLGYITWNFRSRGADHVSKRLPPLVPSSTVRVRLTPQAIAYLDTKLSASESDSVEADTENRPEYYSPADAVGDTYRLHAACFECGPSIVRWCLRNGYDPNLEDGSGWTPLIWLVRMYDGKHVRTRKRIFRWLVKAGARIDHRDKANQDLLALAKGCSRTLYRFIERERNRILRRGTIDSRK